jgi:NADH dehydrogenase [ubiquinone] 1 alpha subcomplex assembly factor 7
MSREVTERIRRRIREEGPITFAEFMEEALYGPGGFYERTPVGPAGHFVTSPHVHPVFSRLVGKALEEMWVLLGRPAPLRIVEVGASDGTMAREILAGFERAGIDVAYDAVEVSKGAREALSPVARGVVAALDELEPLDPGLLVANELLDNLPFRRVRRRGDTLVEVRVGIDGDGLIEAEATLDGSFAFDARRLAEADEAIVPTGALAFVDELGRSLRRGYALLIDYAAIDADQVHGYRDHRLLQDVLEDPGSADVTAGVDLEALAHRARDAGLQAFETVSQDQALVALGLDEWMRAERDHQGEMLASSRGVEAIRAWGGRSRASLLADPAGLGRLRWLVLAGDDLPEPGWLHAARKIGPRPD